MRDDILKVIQGHHEVTNVVILTHNIDFIFAESMVLRALQRCGNPKLTIFADFWCADQSFANQSRVLDRIGIRYRVVPVAAESGYRFHPKVVLLSGTKQGTLLVGSGNLTYGGWRENFEVWAEYESGVDGVGPFLALREYLFRVLRLVPLNQPIARELDEAFDVATHPWLPAQGESAGLLGRVPGEMPLLEQISSRIASDRVDVLTVCSPYYDRHAHALSELTRRCNPAQVRVLCQPGRSGLRRSAAGRIKKGRISFVPIEVRENDHGGTVRTRFVHAKLYAFERGNRVTVVSGSANCSQAALSKSGQLGNAELVAVYALSQKDFREAVLDEFAFPAGDAQLSDHIEDPEERPREQSPLTLLAVQFEAGILRFAYRAARDVSITGCRVDAEPRPVHALEEGYAKTAVEKPPRTVALRGKLGDQDIWSNPVWVHDEHELRSTGSARTLADAIRGNLRADRWGIPAYAEVLRALHKHLEYVPRRSSFRDLEGHAESATGVEFSESDVFSQEFHRPRSGSLFGVSSSSEESVASLRNVLLRWFGFHLEEEPDDDPHSHVDDSIETATVEEEAVDRPAPLPSVDSPKGRDKEDGASRRAAQKLIRKIAEAMTSPLYLQERDPELQATDLKVTSVLLRIGLKEQWITREEFFRCTHQIWTCLFFTSDLSPTEGWLEYRCRTNPSPRTFAASMQSIDLSAALAAWTLAIPDEISTPEEARFALSCVLSVARLPWLWHGGPTKAVASELASVLRHTASEKTDTKQYWKGIESRWLKMLHRGHALRRLEASLKGRTPGDLKSSIFQDHISTGELLWQGVSGFCVADYSCRRSYKSIISVRPLQGTKDKSFQSDYLIPMRALLDPRVIPIRKGFGREERQELASFVAELRKSLRHYEFEDEEDDDAE